MLLRNFELILITIGFFMNFKSCSKIGPKTLYYSTGCYLLGVEGVGGKVLPQTPHLPPQKFEIKKITQSAMRTYTELDQLSDQTLNDIIDKYKYMLLNTRHAWYVARPFPPKRKFLD